MDSEQARELLKALGPLLEQALDLAPDDRAAWLATLRREAPELAAELSALLAGEGALEASGFLAPSLDPLGDAPRSLVGRQVALTPRGVSAS